MNIFLVCPNFHRHLGGTETFVYEYARTLALKGHKVFVVCVDEGDFHRQFIPGVEMCNISLKLMKGLGWFEKFFPVSELMLSFSAFQEVRKKEKFVKVDVVEVMDYFRSGIFFALNKRFPLVLRMHGWMFNWQGKKLTALGNLSLFQWWQKIMAQKVISSADEVISVSRDFAEYASLAWSFQGKEVTVVHNAVNQLIYSPLQGIKKEKSVLFVGKISKIKGVAVLAKAIPEILKDFPDVKFYFAGRDVYWPDEQMTGQEFLKKVVPNRNLVFLGELTQDKLVPYYQKMEVCVFPSMYEPFGLVAIEAMACQCAIVASNTGGIKEIVESDKDGLLVPPDEPVLLARALIKMLQDENFRAKCVTSALSKVSRCFTLDRLVEQSLVVYEQAMRKNGGDKRE